MQNVNKDKIGMKNLILGEISTYLEVISFYEETGKIGGKIILKSPCS